MKKDFRTELGKVRGRGSAHEGTEHFWLQRLTGFINLPLLIFFIVLILSLVGKDYSIIRARLAHPVVAVLMGLLTLSVLYHMKLGMQVVIEDYIPREGLRIIFLVLNILFCFVLGGIIVFALLKIAIGG
ncbi:succinate dehydrogenase, hydrophobic membrane anchor protein [Bartonella henselae]|uniref:Succinate dehydrogenase hydrophobic membrane anchor subunit n=2 Tax=Bartonella henselae TaxID=38323 RepID=X5MGW1_BARHN|nr:succinate dehydrogenase, hydrophobic membrane anchor protein [Bartonella henselae]ATP13002.1 succinate dehydrogenase, hydrophobic membrane anchor protein [Bartonella henselae]ETS04184.1 succinate dehydrogenase, hydrophobic membrane anchor protein [Bartonella henselae JK 50]ETS05012.1 succinate dehydrogenase, hydrophobic membrane anchor protein [Bartonella henselae JK 51]ETS09531.1 succinate dehydrogenase, hydrophobic membrane anchor protein [Bartonella henselae JK 42]ETS12559.1 succinate de